MFRQKGWRLGPSAGPVLLAAETDLAGLLSEPDHVVAQFEFAEFTEDFFRDDTAGFHGAERRFAFIIAEKGAAVKC